MWQSSLSLNLRSPLFPLPSLLAPSRLTRASRMLFSPLSNWICFSSALSCQSVTRKRGVRCGRQTTCGLRLQLARHQVPGRHSAGCLEALVLFLMNGPPRVSAPSPPPPAECLLLSPLSLSVRSPPPPHQLIPSTLQFLFPNSMGFCGLG